MMDEGTILLYRSHGFIGACIKAVTGMPWGHAATYLKGFTWESTIWWSKIWFKTGIRITKGCSIADEFWKPKTPMTEEQAQAELTYWLEKVNMRRPYNIPKLLILAIVYPLRRFFKKWVPFDEPFWGEECSSSVDEAKRAAGIDLFPKQQEGFTAPGDFRKSKLLELVV